MFNFEKCYSVVLGFVAAEMFANLFQCELNTYQDIY